MSIETATGPWETGVPPRDGTWFLGLWGKRPFVARFVDEVWITYGHEYYEPEPPDKWAKINLP